MAITETVLGPNSSQFVFSASDTSATIMAAIDTYVTAHGWEIYDNATTLGITGTSPVGRIYRALQVGGNGIYKYVGIAANTQYLYLKIYDSWNATAHTSNYSASHVINTTSAAADVSGISSGLGTDGNGFVLFVNPKWLAVRTKTVSNVYSHMIGSFECGKDYGEDSTFSTNIFMSSQLSIYAGYSSSYGAGIYSVPKLISANVTNGANTSGYCTFITPFGSIYGGANNYNGAISNMLPTWAANGAVTMVAAELASLSTPRPAALRGRIFGIKLGYGSTSWNDMDTAQIVCDSNYFESATGTAQTFHIIYVGTNFVRFLIPA